MKRLRARVRETGDDEDGSVLILALGYGVLAIAVIIVCVEATGLYLAQKRLDSVADAAALAAADGFAFEVVAGDPVAQLTDAAVYDQAAAIVELVGGATLVSADTSDGTSARVTVAGAWHPAIGGLIVPDGVPLQATATSRTALR